MTILKQVFLLMESSLNLKYIYFMKHLGGYKMKTKKLIMVIVPVLIFTLSQTSRAQVYDTTNYNDSSNWAAHPMKGLADMHFFPDYTLVAPDTVTKTFVHVDYDTTSNFDVFCIYPTTFPHDPSLDSTMALNYPIHGLEKAAARVALRLEFSQYVQFGRIYAPYYRQANLLALGLPNIPQSIRQKQAAILDTAVTDVLGAFDYYMKHDNNGKRVILLGHSQGAIMLAMMLRKMECTPVFQPYLNKIFLCILVGMECGPYVAKNSLTGGWWQNIPICQDPLDTACVMSWATHKYGMAFQSIPSLNHIAENDVLVSKGYLYNTIDTTIHEVKMDPLTYIPSQNVSCSIYPVGEFPSDYGVSTKFIGYTNMYKGYISNPDAANYSFLVERLSVPNDYRHNPLDSAYGSDCHNWDMDVSSCDVLDLIWQKINQTTTSIPSSENIVGNGMQVFPNPASDFITIKLPSDFCDNDESIEIFSVDGLLIKKQELKKTETSIDVDGLSPGIYIVKIISGKSVSANRIVIN
jgi:hypothetical protein